MNKVKCIKIKNLKFFAEVKLNAGIYWPKLVWDDEGGYEHVYEYDTSVNYANVKKEFEYDKFKNLDAEVGLYIANNLSENKELEIIKAAALDSLKYYFGDIHNDDGSILKTDIEIIEFKILGFDKIQSEANEILIKR